MNVTIIGNGNMAKGIGVRLLSGGHQVAIHARDEEKGKELVEALNAMGHKGQAKFAPFGSSLDEIVIAALPYTELNEVAETYKDINNSIVIDITNPVDFDTFQLIPEPGRSGAEEFASIMPEATIVKAFNTVLAGPLVEGKVEDKKLDVFIAGDDEAAKAKVAELVQSSDMRPIDVGPLSNARHLEGFGLIQMAVQDQLGTKWMSALKFIG